MLNINLKLSWFITLTLFIICPRQGWTRHLMIQCHIINFTDGKMIRSFGHNRCLFLNDGRYLSGNAFKLSMYNSEGGLIWTRNINTHHQLNFESSQNQALVMTSKFHKYSIKNTHPLVRFDRISVIDFNGLELKYFDFFEHRAHLSKALGVKKINPVAIGNPHQLKAMPNGVQFEHTHANSVYQIDDNSLNKSHPAFQKGNYIVNMILPSLTFIIDQRMERILWSIIPPIDDGNSSQWHDVQVQPNGWLLVYNNNAGAISDKKFSQIEEIHPLTKERKIIYRATPPHTFYSPNQGGVQILSNGQTLFNQTKEYGMYSLLSKDRKIIWQRNGPNIDHVTQKPSDFQQVKYVDLSDFLNNHKGL